MTLDIKGSIKQIESSHYEHLTPQLLASNQPVVLKGLINDWPLVERARLSNQSAVAYLRQFYNGNKIRSFYAEPEEKGRFFYNEDMSGFNFNVKTTSLEEILNDIISHETNKKPPGLYMGSTSIDHILPEFRQRNDVPPLTDKPIVSLWVGNQSRIAAHYDVTDNVACVAAGRRRFTLFHPDQLDNLYVGPLDFTPAGQPASLVDFHQPDFHKHPKFKNALEHAQVAELDAGDAIFIPSMWWHHVEGLSPFNILVNYWWRQVDMHLGAPMDALNHALLSIRDLPKAQRDTWRAIFEHYVFSPQEQKHIPKDKRGTLDSIDEKSARRLRAYLINNLNR